MNDELEELKDQPTIILHSQASKAAISYELQWKQ